MKKYDESIADESVWVSATPTQLARELPFYVSEAGHFIASRDYAVSRDSHDSFLLLYTISGEGAVRSGGAAFPLDAGKCVIIDCHSPHEYKSVGGVWDFLWVHFCGCGAERVFYAVYPSGSVRPSDMNADRDFEAVLSSIFPALKNNSVAASVELSSKLHEIFAAVCLASQSCAAQRGIRAAVRFIEENYSRQITIEDMIKSVHISKYHFIRLFQREMGTTPYNYLTNYRINVSKTLLRTTEKSVSQIAEECGFLDASNFISHFKRRTSQRPLEYRRDFT